MRRYGYTPFPGSLGAVEGPALAGLREVNQGWYVVYSDTVPSARDLASQLSALANQSGGWLFLGVKGQEYEPLRAETFPGIAASAVDEALVALGVAASAHVTPEVYFETRVIEGPVPEIDLAPGRSIIIVGIPEGALPPYVHSSGSVYRRASDQSQPTSSVDRRELDELRSRAAETRRRLADFVSFETAHTQQEASRPARVYVYLLSDPYLDGGSLDLSHDRFSDLMRSNPINGIIAPEFNNIFTTADGYVARCSEGNEPFQERLALRWWANGNARLSIQVDSWDPDNFPLQSDPRRSDFLRMIRAQILGRVQILDFSEFFNLLAAGAAKYLELRQVLGISGPLWSKIRLRGVRHAVPFTNLRQYIESIKLQGFPVVQDDDLYVPPDLSNLIKLDPGECTALKGPSVLLTLRLAVSALRAVGIDFDRFIKDDPRSFLNDLRECMNFVVEEPPPETEDGAW
jgi:Putative DNA-binding domain